jgi:CRISPR-associated protein Csd2
MPDEPAKSPVSKRYDFVFLFDVTDGNPNGDPDAGNAPRTDPQTRQGLVTDGCIKRKIRNAVAAMTAAGDDPKPGYDLYFQTQDAVYEKRILNKIHERAYKESGANPKAKGKDKVSQVAKAQKWLCENFFDIRAFGAVMSTGEGDDKTNCGQVRGPVQITFARSIDPILPLEFSITRKSVTKESDAIKEIDKKGTLTGTMGRKNTVPYGLYRCYGFINPMLASKTGFTEADLKLLWDSLSWRMWEIDRSAARQSLYTKGLLVFEHDSALGNAPADKLFERIVVPCAATLEMTPRSFADYKPGIQIDDTGLPRGVKLHRLVDPKA